MAFLPIGEKLPRGQPSPIVIDGDLVRIGLGRGLETIVDLADLQTVKGGRWLPFITPTGHVYAFRRTKEQPIDFLHRILLSPTKEFHVDHEDGNGLNNRRKNIRICTPYQNQGNRIVQRNNRLQLKGVRETKFDSGEYAGKFMANIKLGGKNIYLGTFCTKEEASAAYLGAARVAFGEFARA